MRAAEKPLTVAVAIEHTLLRKGLSTLLSRDPELDLRGEAGTAPEAIDLLRAGAPDILVLDLGLPDGGAAAVLQSIVPPTDSPRAVVISAVADPLRIAEVFDLGARAVILRDAGSDVLLECIRHVAAGGYWYDRSPVPDRESVKQISASHRPAAAGAARDFGLTPREKDVLAAVVYGQTNRSIARRYSISEQTVKHHLSSIFDKVGVYNRLELTLFAMHHGLVTEATADRQA